MSIKLLHHTSSSATGGVSPFDEAIVQVVKDKDVAIACPYLSLNYLERLIRLSQSWRVLTDIEEWLACHNKTAQCQIQDFIKKHSEHIHHCKDLHAKVLISDKKAIVGSANFTEKGITARIEVSVLFEQEPQVEELRNWFDGIWSQSAPVDISELDEYVASMPSIGNRDDERELHRPLTSMAPKVRSKLIALVRPKTAVVIQDSKYAHERLIDRIRRTPNREWISSYLDLVKEVVDFTGLAHGDPRLVTSLPINHNGYFLPVSINNRYVLAPLRKRGQLIIGIIYGPEFEQLSELEYLTAYYGRFDPLSGENPTDTPFFLRFNDVAVISSLDKKFKAGWMGAATLEIERASSSPYRKFHEPVVYEAAVNLDYRNAVLDAAFSNSAR